MIRWARIVPILALIATSFGLSGCRQNVDLAALAALGKTVAETQGAFAELSDDFHASCIRTIGWQRAAGPAGIPDAFASCSEQSKAARQWQSANSVVTSYIVSLATLAGGTADAGDFGLGVFASTFASLGVTKTFDDARQKAVAGAAAALIGDYFKAKRRDALAPIVTAADADLGTVITTLEDVARTNYVTQLTTERLAVQFFFEPNIARAKPGLETLQAFAYRATERDAQLAIDKRQGAVGSYIAALENLRQTHNQIARAAASNRLADVAAIVRSYVAAYRPQVAALQKAFE